MKKVKIVGGRENECPICGGNVFKIETSIGIVWQCKDCGCMYQDMNCKESKRGVLRMSCVIKCDLCDETIVEIQNIKVFRIDDEGNIISIGKDMCGKCYDKFFEDNLSKKITNYEKIKNMKRKEIAEFLESRGCGCSCCAYDFQECLGGCLEGREKWLKSDVRE